jgi:aldose 1-epimerase
MRARSLTALAVASLLSTGCRGGEKRSSEGPGAEPTPGATVTQEPFGVMSDGDELVFDYVATTDAPTPVAAGLIPTGELAPVEGTPFDLRTPHAIGERTGADDEQIRLGGGYDHNFVLDRNGAGSNELVLAARVEEPRLGRFLEVRTTEPGIQFYSGNFLDGSLTGKGGAVYGHRSGFCLETQHFPDSPKQPGFPSTILRPGEEYRSRTVLTFGVLP